MGFLIPHLEDTVDVNCVPRVGFLNGGLLAIDGASPEFLAELPTANAAWYHGIFGVEAIRLPDQVLQYDARDSIKAFPYGLEPVT